MKRRWFSPPLWREGLRQLSLIGIMSFVVLELCAILVPVGFLVNSSKSYILPEGAVSSVQSLEGIVGLPLMVLLPLVVAPMMMLYLFRFLNKRSASDFYHQLPVRRECLFLSFFAAVLTWLVGLAVVPALTSRLFFRLLLANAYLLPLDSLWIYVGNMLAGAILAAAATAVAMSVTGNPFNNVVGTVLLLFLPRIVLLVVVLLLREALPILSPDESLPLLDVQYNVPAGMILGVFTGNLGDVFQRPGSGLYSLLLALVYTAAAMGLFVRRQSEAAERASHSPRIQRLLCIVTGFAVSLIPIAIITDMVLQKRFSDDLSTVLFWIAVLYILTLVTMLIYQLITMRRFRALTRVFSAFGIVLALNALFFLSVYGFREWVLAFTPTAEQISGVTFYEKNDFFMDRTSAPELTDEELRRLTAELLSDHVDTIRRDNTVNGSDMTKHTVRIRTGWRTVTRVLYPNAAQEKRLTDALVKNETVIRAYGTLPSLQSKGMSVYCSESLTDSSALPTVYGTFCEEVQTYAADRFADWYRYVQGSEEIDGLTASPFTFRLSRGGATETLYIPWEFTRTIGQLLPLLPDADGAIARLDAQAEGECTLNEFSLLALKDGPGGVSLPEEHWNVYFWEENDEDGRVRYALRDMLNKAERYSEDTTLFCLEMGGFSQSGYYQSERVFFSLSASAQPELDVLVARLTEGGWIDTGEKVDELD